jgi:bifunctional non-homologous end joining protein LigD
MPLLKRKEQLAELLAGLPKNGPIRFSEHVRGEGEKVFNEICAAGHEGTIAKKVDAPYRSRRTRSWQKVKCTRRQELVIAGWTPSTRRPGFASLLLGAYSDRELVYAGRVGTGFDQDDLRTIAAKLERLERKTPPFRDVPREVAGRARWAKPELVAEIAFTEVTPDGALRHPSFLGLREDKPAREVRLEIPVRKEETSASSAGPKGTSAKLAPRGVKWNGDRLKVEGISLSNPERVLFPDQGVTKAELVAYYQGVAGPMLQYGARRPLALVRCPQGRARQCFFQKHDTGGFPSAMKRVAIPESGGEVEEYFYFDGLAGIVAGVQMGVLEFHVWGARIDAIEKPDRLIFDLDPDEGLVFADARRTAFDVRERLDKLGLTTFAMLTGGKGIHVIAPLTRRSEWPKVKAFARGFARAVASEEPKRFTATASKARRKGRIFLDYLRNDRGSTAIAPYSTRRREGAPVAAPVTWEELETADGAALFDLRTMPERVRAGPDPWAGYGDVRQSITKRMMAAVGT